MAITYRTDGAWGSGKGSNLSPAEVDGNFYDVDSRVTTIEDNPVEPIAPIAINIEGSAFTMGLSNGDTLGPIAITYPMPTWRGNWTPLIAYAEMDFFIAPDGGLGAVMVPHTSAATFDWAVIDAGTGLPTYRKLIGSSGATLALDGLTDVTLTSVSNGQLLSYDAAAGYWKNMTAGSGTGTVTSVATGAGLTGGPVTTTGTIALDTVANQRVLANISGTTAAPSGNTMTAIIDAVFGSTRGSLLYRGSGGWAALPPGTDGNVLTTHGTVADPGWATAAGGGASISIADTPPSSPTAGALWWDSAGGQLYLWYNDGSSSQWVPSSNQPGPAGATGPAGSANMSGMTAGQIPIAATATSVTSSIPLPLTVAQGGTNKTSWTAGSVAFAASTTALGEDNANLFWDNTNKRLGIGNTGPTYKLDVTGSIRTTLPASILGSNAGSTSAPTNANTNLLLYNVSSTNYAGIGSSVAGDVYIVTGTSAPATRLMIDAAGNVGIGATTLSYHFHVRHNAAAGGIAAGISNGPNGADSTSSMLTFSDYGAAVIIGAITRNGSNTVAYGTSSDMRLKTAIEDTSRGVEALMSLKVRDYNMGETRSQGLLAQDVAKIYPEAVHEGGDDPNMEPWLIDYGRLTPLLIKSIQQLQEEIATLRECLAALEGDKPAPRGRH